SELISALALVEAAIDFSDEGDVSSSAMQRARELVAELSGKLAKHLDDGHRGEILREGLRWCWRGLPTLASRACSTSSHDGMQRSYRRKRVPPGMPSRCSLILRVCLLS